MTIFKCAECNETHESKSCPYQCSKCGSTQMHSYEPKTKPTTKAISTSETTSTSNKEYARDSNGRFAKIGAGFL